MFDFHMHSTVSFDGHSAPEEMVKAAVAAGLREVCFTDHLDIDYKETPGLFDLDIPAYKKEITLVKEQFADKLDIGWGIELGLQPYLAEKN